MKINFFYVAFLISALISCSSGGGNDSGENVPDSTPLDISSYTVDYSFQEYRGREDHGGLFAIQGAPQAGANILQVETSYPLKELKIDIVPETGASAHYVLSEANFNTGNITTWQTNIALPDAPFKINFTSIFEGNDTHIQSTNTITPTTFSASLKAESLMLSPGEHTLNLSINNKGVDTSYSIAASNSRFYSITSTVSTIHVVSNATNEVPITISIPVGAPIGYITLDVVVTDTTTNIENHVTKEMALISADMPVFIADPVMDILPGICENTLALITDVTVSMVIVGNEKFDVNRIEQNSIIVNDFANPILVEVKDMLSQPMTGCDQIGGDGIDDLVLTFSSADIAALKVSTGLETLPITVNYLYDDGYIYEGYDFIVINP